MKKLLILPFSLLLFGCSFLDTKIPEKSEIQTEATDIQMDSNPNVAALGETCGGNQNIPCGGKNLCQFLENSQNSTGVCVDTVSDKTIECPGDRDPICGVRNNQLNAYQNKCQLDRHGAEFVKKGFCTPDEAVKDNCEAKARGIGTCFENFSGYEFDGDSCRLRYVNGCDSEIPFETKEACESACS